MLDGPGGPLSVTVLPELDGDWLDVDDATAVRAAGASLAAVHLALQGYTDARLWRPAEAEPPDRRVRRWLADCEPDPLPGKQRRAWPSWWPDCQRWTAGLNRCTTTSEPPTS